MKKYCRRCRIKTKHSMTKSWLTKFIEYLFLLDERHEPDKQCTKCGAQS